MYQLVSDVFGSVDIIFWCDSTKDKNQRYDQLRKVMKHVRAADRENIEDKDRFEERMLQIDNYIRANYFSNVTVFNKAFDEEKETGIEQAEFSVKKTEDIKYNWNRIINVGAASDLLKSEVQEHVILLREALGFQYISFWNLFSRELLIDAAGQAGEYNFSRIDAIMDFLQQQGYKKIQ